MPAPRPLEPTQHRELVVLIGDPEAGLEPQLIAELAQQPGAERVDRPALHELGARAELTLEPRRNLAGGLVGEGERADARGVDAEVLDEVPYPLDQAEGLPGARAGEDERRAGRGF